VPDIINDPVDFGMPLPQNGCRQCIKPFHTPILTNSPRLQRRTRHYFFSNTTRKRRYYPTTRLQDSHMSIHPHPHLWTPCACRNDTITAVQRQWQNYPPTCAGIPAATLSMSSHRVTSHDLCDNSHLSIGDSDSCSLSPSITNIDLQIVTTDCP
jgi:hypothetical protein